MAQPQAVEQNAGTLPPGGGFNPLPDADAVTTDVTDGGGEAQVTQVNEVEQQAEVEARTHGWVSKDEWVADGKDPSRWNSASAFLDVRHNVLNIVKDENRQLRAKVAAIEARDAARVKAESEARLRFNGDSLQEELRRAQEEGDTAKVAEVTRKLVDHGIEVKAATAKPATPQVDPELQRSFAEFGASNKWLQTDVELRTDFMIELKKIAEVAPDMDMATALTQAKRRVMRDNPAKFRPNGGGTAMVETGGTGGNASGGTNGRGWDDLKPEVRFKAEEDIKNKKYTKADFLAQCDSPEYFRR